MGARINYVFNDGTESAVVLYSHWGADNWQGSLAEALRHAENRLGDYSYWTRMVISSLINQTGEVMAETGFGIYAVNPKATWNFDQTVVIDLVNKTISDIDSGLEVSFEYYKELGVSK
jgi:hypothetical protein